jgi:hypothetical protein
MELFDKNTRRESKQGGMRNGSGKTILKVSWLHILWSVFLFVSCGIENYIYLEPVEYVTSQGSTSARITIPNNSSQEFRYYMIFYRIYISDQSIDGITTSEQRRIINSTLQSDYNYIDPYTINDNISPSSVGTAFSTRKYYPLYVEIVNPPNAPEIVSMDRILNSTSSGTIDIVFANTGPYLRESFSSLGELPLRRSAGFTASPNRSFFNSTGSGGLSDESRISETSNVDVERNSSMSSSSRYAYVSLYIAATGIDNNFSSVYSRPKHIGIFRLP